MNPAENENTDVDTTVETEKTPFWKTRFARKAAVIVGATAGVIITTALLTKAAVEDEDEDDQDEVTIDPIVDVVPETTSQEA